MAKYYSQPHKFVDWLNRTNWIHYNIWQFFRRRLMHKCNCKRCIVDNIREDKKPERKLNHVGVELEFFSKANFDKLTEALNAEGLIKNVTLKCDGSIRPRRGYIGHELAIIATERMIYKVINKICKVLKAHESDVNSSCGMHIHIDMRNRNKELVFKNLVHAQPILYAMNPKSRKTGGYSHPTEVSNFTAAKRNYSRTGINPCAYEKHKTIEVRVHAGTVNRNKINNWIRLLLAIANKQTVVDHELTKLSEFTKEFKFDNELKNYIISRIKHFENDNNVVENAAYV
jgi:hypothetical protein